MSARGIRKATASTTVVAVAAAGLVTAAVLYDGEAQAEVSLNDSGVWVTKTSAGLVGRFNTESQALDGVLLAPSSSFDVEQAAQHVLLTEPASASATVINPAHLELGTPVLAPKGSLIASGGATTAVLDTTSGSLWVLPFDSADAFDPEDDPVATVDGAQAVTVAEDGTVLAVGSGREPVVVTVPTTDKGAPEEPARRGLDVEPGARLGVTAVGDDAVVLDRSGGRIVLPGGAETFEGAAEAQLQQPSAASDHVLVATTTGLVSQPLGGGHATTRRASGLPAAPVQLGGCAYGAWSQTGQVLRDCAGTDDDVDRELEGLSAAAQLTYRVNRDAIVLNDLADGMLWLAAQEFELVNDWDQTTPKDSEGESKKSDETKPELVDQLVADRSLPNRPPVAKDDELGVRAGRTTVLDVLSNDVDPDGDVLTAAVAAAPMGVVPVLGGAALQADVPAGASGSFSFGYTVTDGRKGHDGAAVSVRIVPEDQNSPPAQTGEPVLKMARGGVASINVLPYFRDPDGDSLVLASADATVAGDEARFRPDGRVEVRDGGGATGRKTVDLTVADDHGMTIAGKLLVDVVATNEPPIPRSDHVVVVAGQAVTVEPLTNDTDPNGDELRLVRVDERAPAQITPNYTAGSFRFVSTEPGSYDVTYQVSDGPEASLGLVRVDVVSPPADAGAPVAVADEVLLPAGGSALVDVLANDSDPAGGVLVVQSVSVPDDAGVTVAVLAHHVLRVAEVRRLAAPVRITYMVSNGSQTSEGAVQVIPIPEPDKLRPPDAAPDEISVHTGDVVTIPVLANDTHPDGLELSLAPDLVEDPDAALGEAFTAQDTVRFRAGSQAGVAHLVYEVVDPHGQRDSAQVTVRILDSAENAAPLLPDVEARVLAGSAVRIVPPLAGTDPDGDLVMLDAIATPGTKGSARIVDGAIEYAAGTGSSGPDTFTYRVVDTRGATAFGTVRVGIARPADTNQPPVALADEVRVRPGRTVAVDAAANDSDPDGDRIGLVPGTLEGAEALDAKVVDGEIVLTTPQEPGVHTFYYGVEDTFAARATGSVTVDVDPEAPLLRPVALDDVVVPADVTGESVTVAVLANDSDPDGVAADLEVTVDEATRAAGVRVDGSELVVPVVGRAQVVTYTVTDRDGLTAQAFVRVPRDGAGPRLRDGLALEVVQGQPLPLELADVVVVGAGRTARLTDTDLVAAVPGTVVVQDEDSLTFTPPSDYTGPATVTFEVADGPDGRPDTRTALLVVPVTVTAPDNLPPTFSGKPTLDVAIGDEGAVDVARFVKDPDGDPISVRVTGDVQGLTTSVDGTRLVAQADTGLTKGTRMTVDLEVSDGKNPPVAGTAEVTLVASTRPLLVATDDVVDDAHQGEPTTVDVLENDSNPFEGGERRIVSATVETGQGTAAVDGTAVVVTPDSAFVGRMVVRYTVADATDDPDRYVEGRIQLTVLGRPERPKAPQVEEVRSETVVLSWEPPVDNGSPITGYTVTADDGTTTACPTTTCTIEGLTNTRTYTFTVTATNDVDDSDPSPASEPATPDASPDPPQPPTLVFGDTELTVSWTNATYTDRSPIECVDLEIMPAPASGAVEKTCLASTSVVWDGLENGTAYQVRVRANNAAPDPSEWGEWSDPETPAAPPEAPAAPTANRVETALGGKVTVEWTEPAGNGDPVQGYHLAVLKDGAQVDLIEVAGLTQAVTGLDPAASYTFTVVAWNKAGDSPASALSGAVVAWGKPATPGPVTASIPDPANTSGRLTVSWTGIGASEFYGPGPYYQVSANGGAPVRADSGFSYTGLNNGTAYTFRVQACNQYQCSDWSDPSNEKTPFTTPGTPGVSVTRNDPRHVNVTVSTPGDGGESIDRIEYRVNGGGWQGYGGAAVVGGAYNTTYRVEARACNAAGCGSLGADQYTTDYDPAGAQLTVTKGAYNPDSGGCYEDEMPAGTQDCRMLHLEVRRGTRNTTVSYTCWTTNDYYGQAASPRQFAGPYTFTTDGNGSFSGDLACIHTYVGDSAWIESDWGPSTRQAW